MWFIQSSLSTMGNSNSSAHAEKVNDGGDGEAGERPFLSVTVDRDIFEEDGAQQSHQQQQQSHQQQQQPVFATPVDRE